MKREDVHRCWAPANEPWSAWVKPVLFANLDEETEPGPLPPLPEWLHSAAVEPMRDAAVVIDLPGETGTLAGVALASHGFRPVPLYNAVPSPAAIVNQTQIMRVLVDGAERVAAVPLGATPAFLLDANRMGLGQAVLPGRFDNRSICRASDFPAAEILLRAGIRRVLVIQQGSGRPAPDLEIILLAWQSQGIALWRKSADEPAAPFVLRPRFWISRLLHAVRSAFLRRQADSSYGELVPAAGGG
jgi:hypothetical protein